MRVKSNLILLMSFIVLQNVLAQNYSRLDIVIKVNAEELQNPFTGGLNSPQFSAVDLNNNGFLDLYVFDKSGNVQLTFLNNGDTSELAYEFAPEYLVNFPPIKEWVLLRDYNNDQVMDLFTYSDQEGIDGVVVYTGKYENDQITFDRLNHLAESNYLLATTDITGQIQNIKITSLDYPSIDDLDGDGDLDILTFDLGGTSVEMYKNLSVELGFGTDSLKFELADDCWGNFKEAGGSSGIILGSNTECPNFTNPQVEVRHAGSTLLTLDLNNDLAKELILGDISSSRLVQLDNGGSMQNAFMEDFDASFPSYDSLAEMPIFLASFYLDVDNDGANDLLVSPNRPGASEDYKNVWWYKNINNNAFPDFEFKQNDFLVNTMLDFGTGARPAFADVNADGLIDFVVGNSTYYVDGNFKDSRLFLFLNIGSATSPKFELVDTDYLNLKQYNFPYSYYNYSPSFGDLDNDGDVDLIVGEETGKLIYLQNMAGEGNPFDFAFPDLQYQLIDAGSGVNPQIVDVNRDGLSDLIIGRRIGKLVFMPNVGTVGVPDFEADIFAMPNNPNFGNVDTRIDDLSINGSCSPTMIDYDGQFILYCGTEHGRIEVYENIDGNLAGDFNLVDSLFGKINEGNKSHLVFADLTGNEKLEVLVGNNRGGLGLYHKEEPVGSINLKSANESKIKIFPNPTSNKLSINISSFAKNNSSFRIYNSVGFPMMERDIFYELTTIDIQHFSSGVYFVEIKNDNQFFIEKIIKY